MVGLFVLRRSTSAYGRYSQLDWNPYQARLVLCHFEVIRNGVSQRIPPDDHGIDTHTGRRDTPEESNIAAVVSLRHNHA